MMNRKTKHPVAWLVCSALVALVAATSAGGARAPAATRAHALTPVTVALLPIEATAQAFYAKQEGFFRRQGLDVKISVIAEPTLIGAAVLSGDAQFGSVSVGALATLKTRSLAVRAVAAGSLHRPGAPT